MDFSEKAESAIRVIHLEMFAILHLMRVFRVCVPRAVIQAISKNLEPLRRARSGGAD
jgi:hypothetical protein